MPRSVLTKIGAVAEITKGDFGAGLWRPSYSEAYAFCLLFVLSPVEGLFPLYQRFFFSLYFGGLLMRSLVSSLWLHCALPQVELRREDFFLLLGISVPAQRLVSGV